jgi:hypothetical protein
MGRYERVRGESSGSGERNIREKKEGAETAY